MARFASKNVVPLFFSFILSLPREGPFMCPRNALNGGFYAPTVLGPPENGQILLGAAPFR